MSALILSPEIHVKIQEALAFVEANPIPWELLQKDILPIETKDLDFKDRPGDYSYRDKYKREILIPFAFRVVISVEQQPAGLIKHLSVSIDNNPGSIPHPAVIDLLIEAFGLVAHKVWLEEYSPGLHAVNIAYLYKPVDQS